MSMISSLLMRFLLSLITHIPSLTLPLPWTKRTLRTNTSSLKLSSRKNLFLYWTKTTQRTSKRSTGPKPQAPANASSIPASLPLYVASLIFFLSWRQWFNGGSHSGHVQVVKQPGLRCFSGPTAVVVVLSVLMR